MNNYNPKLSVTILNYKNPELTEQCVSILRQSLEESNLSAQIIVVDNSAPETAAALRQLLPASVEIIENKENLGFAKANNQGISISKGDYILLLNNDVFVNPQTLQTGLQYLAENPQTGIWAPQLTGKDGAKQVSCARFPSLKGSTGEYLFGKYWDWYPDLFEWQEPREVDSVVGAFILMPKIVIEKVGLLDEDYFFNVEDVDFCKRVRGQNFSIIYDPRCQVVHIGGASQAYRWVNDPYIHRNRILYFRRHHGFWAAFCLAIIIKIGLARRRLSNLLKR